MAQNVRKRQRFQNYVSRIDNEAFHGFRVYIDRPDTPLVRRYFSDVQYGSQVAACQAAWDFRRSVEFQRPTGHVREARNNQGRIGVRLVVYGRPGTGYPPTWAWQVTCYSSKEGETRRSFSVLKYGYVSAYKMALRLRLANSTSAGNDVEQVPEPPAELVEFLRLKQREDALTS